MQKWGAIILLTLAAFFYLGAVWIIEKGVQFSLASLFYTLKDGALLASFLAEALGALFPAAILYYFGYKLLPNSVDNNKAKWAWAVIPAIGIVAAIVFPMIANQSNLSATNSSSATTNSGKKSAADEAYEKGGAYEWGRDEITLDRTKAADWYRKACELGNMDGCLALALMYVDASGYGADAGVKSDGYEALKLATKVCESGLAIGCSLAASLYAGDGKRILIPKDVFKALEFRTKGCNIGLATPGVGYACLALGRMYEGGEGVRIDKDRALELYGKACDFKNEEGCRVYNFRKKIGFP